MIPYPMPSQSILWVLPTHLHEPNLIKVYENQVALTSLPTSPIYSFHHVFDMDTLDTIGDMLNGKHSSIVIYDDCLRNHTHIITGLSSTLPLHQISARIEFIDYRVNEQHLLTENNLLGNNHSQINTPHDLDKYYQYGYSHHHPSAISRFSIVLENGTQLDVIDISGCHSSVLDDLSSLCHQKTSSLLSHIVRSNLLYFIGCVSASDDTDSLEHTLSFTSHIYHSISSEHTKPPSFYSSANTNSTISEFDRNPRHTSLFSSLSNVTHSTVPDSISDDKDTMADLHRQIEELQNQVIVTRERNTHVERELEDLQSSHCPSSWKQIERTQQDLIGVLEWKLEETEKLNESLYENLLDAKSKEHHWTQALDVVNRDMDLLRRDRDQMNRVFKVFERILWKLDKNRTKNEEQVQELQGQFERHEHESKEKDEIIRSLRENTDDIMSNEHVVTLQNRVEELDEYVASVCAQRDTYLEQLEEQMAETEKLQRAHALQMAKCITLDKKVLELNDQLKLSQKRIMEGDTSGMIRQLEGDVFQLNTEKEAEREDFETSYGLALNEIETLKHTILDKTKMIEQLESNLNSLQVQMESLADAQEVTEDQMKSTELKCAIVEEMNKELKKKVKKAVIEQREKAIVDSDMEVSVSPHVIKKVESIKRMSAETRLHKQQVLSQWFEKHVNDPNTQRNAIEKFHQLSEENCQLIQWIEELQYVVHQKSEIKRLPSEMSMSDNEQKHKPRIDSPIYRSPALPPLTDPPTNPLPPLPTQATVEELQKALDEERRLREKAERAQHILEKRMADFMNKKNKFFCF